MENRFHGSPAKYDEYIENSLNKALSEGRITPEDRKLLDDFISYVMATAEHLTPQRRFKLYSVLALTRRYLTVPFQKASARDLEHAVGAIKTAPNLQRNTKSDYIRFLKRFFLWMRGRNLTEIPDVEIRRIKIPRFDMTTKTAEMMLTEEEVKAILSKCRNSRDRAMVMLLYEGGLRVGELAGLRWNQVKFEDWGLIVNVMGKTEKPRMVPCPDSRVYLAAYMNDYQIPNPPPQDELIFWVLHRPAKGKPLEKMGLQYQMVAKMIRTAAEAARIQKKVTCHLFRHSAITQAVRDGMSETVLKSIMWGNVETGMLKTYSHISNPDIVNAVKARYGIPIEPKKKRDRKTFGAQQCKSCGSMNVPTNRFCGKCGQPLDEDAQAAQHDIAKGLVALAALGGGFANMTPEQLKKIGEMIQKKEKEKRG